MVHIALLASLFLNTGQDVNELPTSITLERTECFGTCPVYKVTILASGEVNYHGEAHVQNQGDIVAKISEFEFARIASKVRAMGFESFLPSYTSSYTDQPSAITTVKWNKRSKEVSDYGCSGPESLWDLDAMIDGIVFPAVEGQVVEEHPDRVFKAKPARHKPTKGQKQPKIGFL